jgi:hypothetical protein
MGENLRAVTKRRVGTELANVRSCQFAEIVKKRLDTNQHGVLVWWGNFWLESAISNEASFRTRGGA